MTIAPLTYSEWRMPSGVVTHSAEEARLLPGEPTRHDWQLFPPGTRIRHANYQLLVGAVVGIAPDPETMLPYVIDWDSPRHAALALGIESTRQHPSKIRSLDEPVR